MWAVDGKLRIYLEWPNKVASMELTVCPGPTTLSIHPALIHIFIRVHFKHYFGRDNHSNFNCLKDTQTYISCKNNTEVNLCQLGSKLNWHQGFCNKLHFMYIDDALYCN